jgi:DNA-binding SARP family transcriptional activator
MATITAGECPRPALVERYRVVLLNGFRCFSDDALISLPEGSQRLLVLLCLSGHPVGRAQIAGTLWPEVTEQRAQGSLRSGLFRLGEARGTVSSRGDALALAAGVSVDLRKSTALARDLFRPGPVVDLDWTEAISILSSELLPGWYDDWVLLETERWRQLRLHGLEAISRRLVDQQRFGEALDAAMSAVQAEPLRESAHIAVIKVHLAEGNRSEAVAELERYARLIADELGVEPSENITWLVEAGTRP